MKPRYFVPLFLGISACHPQPKPTSVPQATQPIQAAPAEPPRLRLGDSVRPIRNAVKLRVVPNEDTFVGTINVELSLKEPLKTLWLNGTDLTVEKATLESGGQLLQATILPGGKEMIGFAFAQPVGPGGARLHISYKGKVSSRDGQGLARYQENGEWYLLTHFEPHRARLAFPCFDEPSFKVPWQVTLEVRQGDLAFSNTPVVSETEQSGGFRTVTFAETKPLPSYLVAIGVGPFDIVDVTRAGQKGTPIRIITPRGRASEARYAAEVSPVILELLESYFGIPYPYEKLDLITVPSSLGGAMENVGLVTYRQNLLIAPPEGESLLFKRNFAELTAHEFGHMWFGNLVTTAWWDDIWLNEGFAAWIAAKLINEWKPEWYRDTRATTVRSGAMSADSLVSARQVRQPITSEHDILNAFDAITYQKGASVLRMFENWLGEDIFRRGIHRYLERHAGGNATAADFLTAVSEEAGKDIRPAFSTFLDQPGVPLVSVALRCERGAKPRLALTQERYLPAGSTGSPDQVWQIPICAKFKAGKSIGRECTLLSQKFGELELNSAPRCPDWVLANEGEVGYYRVLHSGNLSGQLRQHWNELSFPEQIGFVSDLTALTEGGKTSYSEILGIVPMLVKDGRSQLVLSAISVITTLKQNLVPSSLRPSFSAFVRQTFGPRAKALGWKPHAGENEDAQLIRPPLLALVADVGEDPSLQTQAVRLAQDWLRDRRAIDRDSVETVLTVAAAHGGLRLFERFRAEAQKTSERLDRMRLVQALGAFRDPDILSTGLALTLSEEFEPRESIYIVIRASLDAETRDVGYTFVKQNFDALVRRLPRDFGAVLPNSGARYCDREHRADVEAFFKERSTQFTGGPRMLSQVLERISLCIALQQIQQSNVAAFFQRSRHSVASDLSN
jgi:alanyl aminopeptidase